MIDNLTLVTCSFETPKITYSMLQSFVANHGPGPHDIVILENSRNNETSEILEKNKIIFSKNPGGTHSPSVEIALNKVKTKYALLLDTDVIFLKPIDDLFNLFKKNGLTLMGQLMESRGGYNLYPRISPHACFINIDNIRKHNIHFHDQEKIDRTGSNGFFGNIPIQKNNGGKYYDCGSSFFEDIQNTGLKIGKINSMLENTIYHAESGSWATKSGIPGYIEMGKQRENNFFNLSKIYSDVSIYEKFNGII